jgi:hypothetical protein
MDTIIALTHVMGMTFLTSQPKTYHDPHVNNDDDNFVEQ